MEAETFLSPEELKQGRTFLETGRVIQDVSNRDALDKIRDCIATAAADELGMARPADPGHFLDHIHDHVGLDKLNDFRLHVHQTLNAQKWLRSAYFALAKDALLSLVGNELAMQNRVNLSIQVPHDDSSLLPIHSDVWSGDSPYEAVVWVPLVNCHDTKSMYLAPPKTNRALHDRLADFAEGTSDDLFKAIEGEVEFLNVQYGQVVVFNQTLVHGNRVNIEKTTRWSLNCRFKGLTTPYADKKLGEFFSPITLRPMTEIGMAYALHEGFSDE